MYNFEKCYNAHYYNFQINGDDNNNLINVVKFWNPWEQERNKYCEELNLQYDESILKTKYNIYQENYLNILNLNALDDNNGTNQN